MKKLLRLSTKRNMRRVLLGLALPALVLAVLTVAAASHAASDTAAYAIPTVTRAFRVDNQTVNAGQTITVPVRVDANGDEFGYTFSLSYEQAKLTNPVVTIGNSGGDVVSNTMTAGQIGFSVTSFSGGPIAAGTNKILVNVQFTVAGNAPVGTTPVNFTDTPARRKASPNDPNMPITQPTYTNGVITINAATPAASRAFRVGSQTSSRNAMVTVPIFVDTIGDEFGYTFSLSYDTAILINPVVTIGNSGGDVVFNTNNPGQIGFSVTSFAGGPIGAGTNKILVNVRFTVTSTAPQPSVTPINFTDTPARRKASPNDPNMPITQPTYTNGTVTISSPTAATATVSGRVMAERGGRGIPRVTITITNTNTGKSQSVLTNGFGYYSFPNVTSSETYEVSARAKRYTFEPSSQIINVNEDLAKIDFVGR